MHRLRRWLRRHDPESYAQHRAVRLTLSATLVLAVAHQLIGDPQVVTFGVFGTFALLLFADFPGSPAGRLGAYTGLVLVGSVLICLGTVVSRSWWTATLGMLVVGTLVAFAGTVSAAIASARNATLLLFILPVTVPSAPGEIGARLLGWALAAAVCIPAALLLWPPREHDMLRAASARVCGALGARLGGVVGTDEVDGAFDDLRRALRGTAYRPVTLTTGSRLLLRLADELEWLHQLVRAPELRGRGVATVDPSGGARLLRGPRRRRRGARTGSPHPCGSRRPTSARRRPHGPGPGPPDRRRGAGGRAGPGPTADP